MLILFVCLYLSMSEIRLLQSIKVTIIWVPRFLEYLDLIKKWICSSVIWSLCECLPAEVLTGTFLVCSKGPDSHHHQYFVPFITQYIWIKEFLTILFGDLLESNGNLFCHSLVCIKTYYVTVVDVFMMIWHKVFISLYQQNITFGHFKV